MKETQIIRDFNGKIIGRIEIQSNGDKIVRDFYGHILGRYNKRDNITRDFYGRTVARGDSSSMLISTHKR